MLYGEGLSARLSVHSYRCADMTMCALTSSGLTLDTVLENHAKFYLDLAEYEEVQAKVM